MKARWPFKFALLATICLTLATVAHPLAIKWSGIEGTQDVMKMFFGEGRTLLAEQLSREADVYFHSGYYPSMFDQANKPKVSESPMVTGEEHHHDGEEGHDEEEEAHEKAMAFLGKPRDWIEAVGRHFMVTEHTHLHGGREREMLPWLEFSAAADPHQVQTYVVASYWLSRGLGKTKEAEDFLRKGLRANPNSPELLFELGRLYHENFKDPVRAHNVWTLALRRWNETEGKKESPDFKMREKIAAQLGYLEEEQGNYEKAISYLELAKKDSPSATYLENHIEELKQKIASEKNKP